MEKNGEMKVIADEVMRVLTIYDLFDKFSNRGSWLVKECIKESDRSRQEYARHLYSTLLILLESISEECKEDVLMLTDSLIIQRVLEAEEEAENEEIQN